MEAFLSTIHDSKSTKHALLIPCSSHGPLGKRGGEGNIHYLQSQNGNLFTNKYFEGSSEDPSEFEPLRADVLAEVPWCTEALGRSTQCVLEGGNRNSVRLSRKAAGCSQPLDR